MSREVISISDLPARIAENPESIYVLRVRVYDKEGNDSIIRAHELDRFLGLGFLAESPKDHPTVKAPQVVEAPQDVEPRGRTAEPVTHPMVYSYRTRSKSV